MNDNTIWVDADPGQPWQVGDVGFLVYRQDLNHRDAPSYYRLQRRPQRTNMSGRPCLNEWCGTTNNIFVAARGLARVVRVTGNGKGRSSEYERMQLAPLPESEWPAALEELGWPDLLGA